ncbi:hypothetical protein K1T71_005734 [Dendrolimus kikuchii]|uniref:Uncharacterized protein n=1 Tax=Dendrolimus kikuchii TaxID=765133 RepID=A0ACC1D5F8_9NEOP|nr:hypothetical protein K1T71_005734 [Dendrolimus kikuchii]
MYLRALVRRIVPSSFHILKLTTAQSSISTKKSLSPYISQCFINVHTTKRMYTQETAQPVMNVDYDYVQQATGNNNVLIVDVREPDEVKEHGKIPNSVNIPLGNITPVLSMSENEFQNTYNRAKPTPNSEIIFYCMIGKRSGKAQQNATELGYKNAKNYVGSWNDWASKQK